METNDVLELQFLQFRFVSPFRSGWWVYCAARSRFTGVS